VYKASAKAARAGEKWEKIIHCEGAERRRK